MPRLPIPSDSDGFPEETRAAMRHIAQAMQVMGANGFRHDAGHPLARHLAAAKMAEWLDGATEIQNVVIARSLLRG